MAVHLALMRQPGDILLIACYELGHQPLAVAWPAAFLERAGYSPTVLDLSVEPLDAERIRRAKLIAVSVPMHTALRLGVVVAERIRSLNPTAHLCFYGLYANLNAAELLATCADTVLAGELESELVELVRQREAVGSGGGAGGRAALFPRGAGAPPPAPPPPPPRRGGPRAPRRVPWGDVRLHCQDRAPAAPARAPGRAGRARLRLHRLRRRIARRRRARAAGQGPHARGHRRGPAGGARGRDRPAADLGRIHAVDDARRLSRLAGLPRRRGAR